MKVEKHHYQIAGLVLLLALLIIGAYRLFFRTKVWEKMAGQLRNAPDQRQAPSGRTKSAYAKESFPLKQGMKGSKIAQLQRYLQIEDDGIWGNQTSIAFKKSNLFAPEGSKVQLGYNNYYAFRIDQL